jgi:uncharacterized membrane protein YhfC
MISYLNLLSGIGMIAVGAGAIVYWHLKKHPKIEYFLYGAILWACAIAIKLAMDLTITQPIQSYFKSTLPILAVLLIMSAYVGLRTGIFESGIVYVAVKYLKLSKMSWNDAVATGIGFGGAEAIILGILSLAEMIIFITMPTLFYSLPLSTQDQFALVLIPLPVFERLFTLFVHTFTVVLAIYAVKLKDLRWLWLSIGLKTVVDGALPIFNYYTASLGMFSNIPIELYVAVLGIISLGGLMWFGKKYSGGTPDASQA